MNEEEGMGNRREDRLGRIGKEGIEGLGRMEE
jgi:hypothetical protein